MPFLFLFFNTNSIKNIINKYRKTILFVNNYFILVTGNFIVNNIDFLENQVMSLLKYWVIQYSAIFWLDKFYITLFT